MKLSLPQLLSIAVTCVVLLLIGLTCIPGKSLPEQPEVNPLTSELEMANKLIDNLVSFNNLLIKDLEACEDERTIRED